MLYTPFYNVKKNTYSVYVSAEGARAARTPNNQNQASTTASRSLYCIIASPRTRLPKTTGPSAARAPSPPRASRPAWQTASTPPLWWDPWTPSCPLATPRTGSAAPSPRPPSARTRRLPADRRSALLRVNTPKNKRGAEGGGDTGEQAQRRDTHTHKKTWYRQGDFWACLD